MKNVRISAEYLNDHPGYRLKPNAPTLSLILCSRNDEYMGNSRWRLETTLDYVAAQVDALERLDDVEILVADWGSETPLREVLRLTPMAAAIASFVLIPPEIARQLQKDSPFPEVLALNAAARRARGKYIGRIDQDTLVGRRFLEVFFDLSDQKRQIGLPLNSALLFSNVRLIPYRLAVRCPPMSIVSRFIDRFGNNLKIELTSRKPFHMHSVGIWLLPRSVWHQCGGYDEKMLYMNDMEINMIERLMPSHKLVDLGKIINYDFYHLEHYHPRVPRKSSVYRKVNPKTAESRIVFHPNNDDWGLKQYSLVVTPYLEQQSMAVISRDGLGIRDQTRFARLLLPVGMQIACDVLILGAVRVHNRWNSRMKKLWTAIRHERLHQWPNVMIELWRARSRGS